MIYSPESIHHNSPHSNFELETLDATNKQALPHSNTANAEIDVKRWDEDPEYRATLLRVLLQQPSQTEM